MTRVTHQSDSKRTGTVESARGFYCNLTLAIGWIKKGYEACTASRRKKYWIVGRSAWKHQFIRIEIQGGLQSFTKCTKSWSEKGAGHKAERRYPPKVCGLDGS